MSVRGVRINSSSNLSPTLDFNFDQTFEEIFKILDVTIKNLLKQTDYTNIEVFRDLKLVQKQTRYTDDLLLHHHVVDKIVRSGIGHVFLRSWPQLSSRDYFDNHDRSDNMVTDDNTVSDETESCGDEKPDDENFDERDGGDATEGSEGGEVFRNFQYILSIVWNCTDSNVQLCESLVRSSVVYEMLLQLSKPRLIDAKYYSMEESTDPLTPAHKRVYLMKAYLGILHNIARHCPESRKMFRSAGALRHLQALVRFPNEVIRAKTYLTLSYIVSGDDDDSAILEAADDIASFIVSILREALGSVNHFVVRYAFWASEIASGINHLAINDANKVRLGKLGVIQLYASMLLDGDEEEKLLASSGIWILSFHFENKKIIRSDQVLVTTLSQMASRSSVESVSRSLRGALWVARSNPNSLLEGGCFYGNDDDDDPSQEHIMISYHWSSQKTMVKVRDMLYAKGYKVWFDVDNMRGSTLEAMALAVERSAVILICMSQSYKESPNCRTEAEYAFKMRKDIIPIVTQSGFKPDGWLGMLAGTRLYFDFSPSALQWLGDDDDDAIDSEVFGLQMERLVREIGLRGKKKRVSQGWGRPSDDGYGGNYGGGGGNGGYGGNDGGSGNGDLLVNEEIIVKTRQQQIQVQPGKMRVDSGISSAEVASGIINQGIINQGSSKCHKCGALVDGCILKLASISISSSTPEFEELHAPLLLPSPTPLHTYRQESTSREVKGWRSEQVKSWLKLMGLEKYVQHFTNFTGRDLLTYKVMMRSAPEFFFGTLKQMELVDMLRFSEALEKI